MKIGFFTGTYLPRKDGGTYTVRTWRKELEERGHEVHIFYPKGDYEPEENEHPVRAVNNPFYYGHNFPGPLFRLPDLDVAHVHSQGPMGISVAFLTKITGMPSVFTHHTRLEDFADHFPLGPLTRPISKLYIFLENILIQLFDEVTANNANINRKADYHIIPAGVDTEFFQPADGNLIDGFFDNNKPVIGYSGRLSEEKNIEEIIKYTEDLDFNVLICGNGRNGKNLKETAHENVKFIDFVDREKLPELLSSLDVYITASHSDTLNLSSLEANACGTPVLAPNVNPFKWTIEEKGGELYENREEFREKLQQLINSDRETKKNAERFSVETSIDRLEKIYQDLVDES